MPDMYAIQPASSQSEKKVSTLQCTPNIIPCRIHHDGPIDSLDRYWTVKDEKGMQDKQLWLEKSSWTNVHTKANISFISR